VIAGNLLTLRRLTGGECADAASCKGRQGSSLASSKYFPPLHTMDDGLLRADAGNPTLRAWNRVHLPYCRLYPAAGATPD